MTINMPWKAINREHMCDISGQAEVISMQVFLFLMILAANVSLMLVCNVGFVSGLTKVYKVLVTGFTVAELEIWSRMLRKIVHCIMFFRPARFRAAAWRFHPRAWAHHRWGCDRLWECGRRPWACGPPAWACRREWGRRPVWVVPPAWAGPREWPALRA